MVTSPHSGSKLNLSRTLSNLLLTGHLLRQAEQLCVAFPHSEQHLRRQPDLLGLAVVVLPLLLGRRKFWGDYGASYCDRAIFLLLLLISLVFGHLLWNHVLHQACVPVLALRNRWHMTLLRVVKERLRCLLPVVRHIWIETLLSNRFACGAVKE